MRRFADRVALVTGAASGIGRATAERLSVEGARVYAVDLQADRIAGVAAELTEAGGQADGRVCDVADEAQVRETIAACVSRFGKLDVLCNVAGILRFDHFHELATADWQRILAVNLTGTFLCAHYALPQMLAQGCGTIINLASPHAFQTGKHIAAYAASKGGIVALTRQMALDYGRLGVRVNCVVPGAVDTPMLRADIQQGADWEANLHGWERNQPIGRLGQPADIAKVIVWLASEDAAFVLGAPIIADGGLLAQLLP